MGALEDLAEKWGIPDDEIDAVRTEAGPGPLRERLKKAEKEAAKVPDLESKVSRYESAPQVKAAFTAAGVDWEAIEKLPPVVLDSVQGFTDFGDAEKLSAFIQANRLPVTQQQNQQQGQPQPGQQGQQQGNGQPQTPAPAPGTQGAQGVVNQAMGQNQQTPPGYSVVDAIKNATEEELPNVLREAGVRIHGEDQ